MLLVSSPCDFDGEVGRGSAAKSIHSG